jgi:hypothetical protein
VISPVGFSINENRTGGFLSESHSPQNPRTEGKSYLEQIKIKKIPLSLQD